MDLNFDVIYDEIKNAIKQQKTSNFTGRNEYKQTFLFSYEKYDDSDPIPYHDRSLPYKVGWKEYSEYMDEVIVVLYEDILCQIKNDKKLTIFTKSNDDKKRWIRRRLATVLNNKIFNEQIKRIEYVSTDEITTEEGDKKNNQTDEIIANEYEDDHLIDLIEIIQQNIKNVELQKEAFFWTPNNKFLGKELKGEKSDRAMYVGFFYLWLRRCSGLNDSEIANHLDASSISRDWKPNYLLEIPFKDINNFCSPVYFSELSLENLGMYNNSIRCYTQKDYKERYKPVNKIKTILWEIYELLIDTERIDSAEMSNRCFDKNTNDITKDENIPFTFEIQSNEIRKSFVCVTNVNRWTMKQKRVY